MSGTITPAKTIREYTESTSPATSAAILIQPTSGSYLWTSITNLLSGLVSKTVAATISAVHTFNPGSAAAPFILHSNAQGQLVGGLNADQLDGQDGAYYQATKYASVANSSAIASTASETAFSKSYTIPAAALVVGSVVTLRARGFFSTTGTPTLTFRGRVGGVSGTIFGVAAFTTPSGASNLTFDLTFSFVVRTTGSGGTFASGPGWAGLDTGNVLPQSLSTGSGAVNTTTTNDLVLTAQWGTSSASNTTTLGALIIEHDVALANS